jgi:hypothetical protein
VTRRRVRPVRLAADLFVYAPLGFLVEAPRLVPELVSVGRQRVSDVAGVGRVATDLVRSRVHPRPRRRLRVVPARRAPGTVAAADVSGTVGAADGAIAGDTAGEELIIEVIDETGPAVAPATTVGGGADDPMPIQGYDLLAASQVVARLRGLDADQLAVVEAHERAHRNRSTILAKIAQLRRS